MKLNDHHTRHVARRIRCPQTQDDILQESLIAAWQTGIEDARQVMTIVKRRTVDAIRSAVRRAKISGPMPIDIPAGENGPDLEALAAADPQDVADALAYLRGEIPRTPSERKAHQRRIERIRDAVR
jgi:DNA-directed RNA polymerase specialized sigma24 family protein